MDLPKLSLITDRSKSDVDRWRALRNKGWGAMTYEEQVEWNNGMRGAYSHIDRNRVGNAVKYIADYLVENGYKIEVNPKTDWNISDSITQAQLEQYLDDVRTLKSVVTLPENTPDVPNSMLNLTYEQANDIERILDVVQISVESMIRAMLHSDQILFYSGFAVYIAQQKFSYAGLYTNDNKEFIDSNSAKVYVRGEEEE